MKDNRLGLGGILSSKRLRSSLFFLAAGIGIGAWASNLPLLSAKMDLDKGELGTLLLCFALGAIVLMVNAGRYLDRSKNIHRVSLVSSVTFGIAVAIIPFIGNIWLLGAVVFVAGAAFGTLDVSMNTEASAIERATGHHLMSSFHAMFSIGNIIGAFFVGKAVAYGGTLLECLGGGGLVVLLTAFSTLLIVDGAATQASSANAAPVAAQNASFSLSQRRLIYMFGAIGFLAFLAEGGMLDWTAIYMVDILHASESQGAYAFATFAAAMAIGRLCGDFATKRIGHANLLKFGGIVCAVSILAMLLANNVTVTLIVLAFCGLGVANMIPAVFASAGHIGAHATGRAMAIVTTMGYSGLLLGPALLGFVAQTSSLTVSFGLITLAFAVIATGTLHLSRRLKQHHAENQPAKSFA
ncbi:MFS family permease [Phyllobacterium sp. 1468]|uniref:MFS transporter n=1 Tax=Phyllobacterium sp. 1468 TaxID=2817759 RepID=UPI00285E68DD|nr:MFS transporter [Phyllobacterium sp. 1468]MDR6635407.1 MFS family permease [Phyllobacterium sp. 1468]